MPFTPAYTPDRIYDTARSHGLRMALTAQHSALSEGIPVLGPGGHAVVPAALDRSAALARTPSGHRVPLRAEPLSAPILVGADMAALRCADMSGMATAVPDAAYHQWCEALTWLRLGLCDRLLDIVLAHLSERSFDGEPLLRQQLLKGSLADVEIERLELLSVLATTASGSWELPTLAVLHERITDNARTLLHLCGAHGFTLEEPGVLAYTSELLSDVYLGTCDVGAAI